LQATKKIENALGRIRTEKWGSRIIDIDILFYGDQIINHPDLCIPHPGIPLRKFTLVPLSEIASDIIHPVSKKNIKTLLAECPDELEVRAIK
jgi:2-amino-4-hydroxy-6-hydroxymethyldihydropteridine diphosphokinase